MKTDIEIAQEVEKTTMAPITDIAGKIGLSADDLENYGNYKAKLTFEAIKRIKTQKQGKLVLVTSINPTPAGEGKSTVSVGLADALNAVGTKAVIALREPSMGPVMGMKGGATGGGKAQLIPMEDINLHFTGDMHALTSANDTLAALIDNHIQQGNELNLDPRRIQWKRVLDINDRSLRQVVTGLGGPTSGVPRQAGFDITVASELMAILCLSENINDLKKRIANITIGYTYDKKPISVADLKVQGAITMLLRDALKPNLVQTLEKTPAFVHGGPFANIAHGCNSVLATKMALGLGEVAITEGGFGADLGGEKFMDIAAPAIGHTPDATVIVATIRALKYNGGVSVKELTTENLDALEKGFVNLKKHIENMQRYHVPVVVSINAFVTDTKAEIDLLKKLCSQLGVTAVNTEIWEKGSAGGVELANAVNEALQKPADFQPLYDRKDPVEAKINAIAQTIYGAKDVVFSGKAKKDLKTIQANHWNDLAICMAKTQYSLTDDQHILGAPKDFSIHVREIIPKTGSGFLVVLTGSVLTMPGLPKKPAALNMDVDENGVISGLF